ncbi:hypothetical protein Q3G72_008363 [Acer saccharum]|nr:hypothetical protein Q3G72_008363 [Acer saccharum]
MEAFPRTKELYELVLNKKWEKMKKEISKEKDIKQFLQPISIHQDNIIHLAVHSKEEEPLQQILEIVDSNMRPSFTSSVNAYGNTVLHEAAICRNYKAVKLLVKSNKELLDMKNDSGETPLYRAAAYGNTKIVKFLISQQGQRVLSFERKVQLKGIHRNKKDGASILRAAIQGKHFGTALELLKVDEELAELEDKNGSSLYILANIPSVFKSKNQMGIWEKLFYHCLPVGYGHDDSIEKIKEDKDPDIESGLIKNLPAGSDQDKKEENGKSGRIYKVSYKIYISIWDVIIREHYKGGARSGPAYQLLEELKWFKRVEKIVPSYYTMLPNNNDMTAYEVFEESHKIQHKEAQQWIKDASQSCSAVAALVSTVVFAAAFTVPGGLPIGCNHNDNGTGKIEKDAEDMEGFCSCGPVVGYVSFTASLGLELLGFALLLGL